MVLNPPTVPLKMAAKGASTAKLLALRGIARSQITIGTLTSVAPGGPAPTYIFLRDLCLMSEAFPGFFTKEYLRPALDRFVGTIGGDLVGPNAPAEWIDDTDTPQYRPGIGSSHYPTFDNGPYLVLLGALVYERGDTSVYAAYQAQFAQALSAATRNLGTGCIYSDPLDPTTGWGFEDGNTSANKGDLGMATALHAVAYKKLASMALAEGDSVSAATFTAEADGLVSALASLRRVDGFYNTCSYDSNHNVILTSMVVNFGLASENEILESAQALYNEYTASSPFAGSPAGIGGSISQRGGVRHLVYPEAFLESLTTFGHYQNGAAWLGQWTGWLARALSLVNLSTGIELIQSAVDEVLREYRAAILTSNAIGPVYEWSNAMLGNNGGSFNGAAAGFLAFANEESQNYGAMQVSGSVGATAFLPIPRGSQTNLYQFYSTQPETLSVDLSAQAFVNSNADPVPPVEAYSFDIYDTTITTSNELVKLKANPWATQASTGGRLKATISSGSTSGSVFVRPLDSILNPRFVARGAQVTFGAPAGVVLTNDSFGWGFGEALPTFSNLTIRDDTGAPIDFWASGDFEVVFDSVGVLLAHTAQARSAKKVAIQFSAEVEIGPGDVTISMNGVNFPVASVEPGLNDLEVVFTLRSSMPNGVGQVEVRSASYPGTGVFTFSPTTVSFVVDFIPELTQEPLVQGATNDEPVDIIRRFLPPVYRNKPGWEAMIAALAAGDATVRDNAYKAFNQLFLSTASSNYLIERAADQGVQYPETAGITEESFRKLAVLLSNNRQIQQALLGILEVFYGYDSTHAHLVSGPAPFALTAGDTITFVADDRATVTATIDAADFDSLNNATATEVAAVISRAFRDAKSDAFAVAQSIDGQSKVVVYSGAVGLLGSLRVTEGLANLALQFPTQIDFAYVGSVIWQRIMAAQDEFRLVWTNNDAPANLIDIEVGDYVYIDAVGAPEIRGAYQLTDVHVNADVGTGFYANQTWISFKPPPGFAYTDVGTPGTNFTATAGEISFHRASRYTVAQSNNPAFIAQHNPVSGVDIILPVTTEAVGRAADAAAYLHETSATVDAVGPFLVDPDGFAVTGTETTSTATVASGRGISVLPVASTAGFPTTACQLVLGFGTQYEVGPVRCLGIIDSNNLSIDRSFVFSKTVPSGSTVTLLGQAIDTGENIFSIVDSAAGRIAAERFLDETKAAGVNASKIVVYPGDRGLGGEGDPVTGINLSDKVAIWASDEVDAAVEAAHNA